MDKKNSSQKEINKIERRNFIKTISAGSLTAIALGPSVAASASIPSAAHSKEKISKNKTVLMKVGCQYGETTMENLEFKARHGVFNISGGSPKYIEGVGWDLNDSLAKRELCEKYGISLDAYHLPLSSDGINKVRFPNIMLGKSPARDREIEMLQQMISVAGKSGIRCLNYNTTILPILRTGLTVDPKRGNASYRTWNYPDAVAKNEPLTIAGVVPVDEMFSRITYLLDKLIPVAEEYKVQLANHIADPPTHAGFRGITRWNSPDVFEGIKRFANLYDSPYHGFNFCLGSVAEGLKDSKNEILPIIQWVGERKKIFNVHLRNIKGGFDNFQEVYPDNGDLDFFQIIRLLKEVDYPYLVMPDHVPHHADPASNLQGFAFAYGYIKAMIRAVSEA